MVFNPAYRFVLSVCVKSPGPGSFNFGALGEESGKRQAPYLFLLGNLGPGVGSVVALAGESDVPDVFGAHAFGAFVAAGLHLADAIFVGFPVLQIIRHFGNHIRSSELSLESMVKSEYAA